MSTVVKLVLMPSPNSVRLGLKVILEVLPVPTGPVVLATTLEKYGSVELTQMFVLGTSISNFATS